MIDKTETMITGKFIEENGRIVEDDICKRINFLVNQHLIRIASDESGWDTLYKDRFWSLFIPKVNFKEEDLQSLYIYQMKKQKENIRSMNNLHFSKLYSFIRSAYDKK